MMPSEHFSWEEVTHTDHEIANELPPKYAHYAIRLAEEVLEPWRVLASPLKVNSWFRCPSLNKAVGGETFSAHLEARAADVVPRGNIENAFKMLLASDIPFDKAILEHRNSDWVHVQINADGLKPRRMALEANLVNGRMEYKDYHA